MLDCGKEISNTRFYQGIIESSFLKYGVTLLANYLIARPLMSLASSEIDIIELYSQNAGFLVNLCNSLGKISTSGNELNIFESQTRKVTTFLSTLTQISEGTVRSLSDNESRKFTIIAYLKCCIIYYINSCGFGIPFSKAER